MRTRVANVDEPSKWQSLRWSNFEKLSNSQKSQKLCIKTKTFPMHNQKKSDNEKLWTEIANLF